MNAPCANYEIEHFDLHLVMAQVLALTLIDAEQRQKLAECTPLPWDSTPRHGEEL